MPGCAGWARRATASRLPPTAAAASREHHMPTAQLQAATRLGPFGAEITPDLSQPLTPAAEADLRDLLWEHQLLLFRGQRLSHARQIEIMETFAPVLHTAEGAHYISTEK